MSASTDWIAEPSSAKNRFSCHSVVSIRKVYVRTDLVELDGVELCATGAQQLLGLVAVWAVGL